MDSDSSFNGIAIFLVLAVFTGVIGYLAVQQSKIKKQIEESRRLRERDDLAGLGGPAAFVPTTPSAPPDVSQEIIPDITPSSLPKITPGGTPPVPPSRPRNPGGASSPPGTSP